ncbi:MAG: Malate/L-lactate dehydrogenase [Verrucomicrobia bacterium]|nr:Malate/L-lactate dehydrogenase [Verrucomicrobiota bacterium]
MSSFESADRFLVVPRVWHDALIAATYRRRGYAEDESTAAGQNAAEAARHGIRTHNGIKALHIESKHRAGGGGAVPHAAVSRRPGRFSASEVWDANRKLGQIVAQEAIETCIRLAEVHGIGQVSVDNAFHYLWGGGYVMEAARRGYIAYTNCTAARAEVVPFGGRAPTLGTNPHSWAFPTCDVVGFPIVIDWATSVIAMGRIDHCRREGHLLPPGAAVDADGAPTVDPAKAAALLPFGAHKGYGLGLVNELMAAFIGGSLPTLRAGDSQPGEKHTSTFYFQVIHPDAIAGSFASGRTQRENVGAVLADILGHGNENARLPGQNEATAAARSDANGGLLFTAAEIAELNLLATENRSPALEPARLKPAL